MSVQSKMKLDGGEFILKDVSPDQIFTTEDFSEELSEALRLIEVGHFSNGDTDLFLPLLHSLHGNDPYFVMADFEDYLRAQDDVNKAWVKPKEWNRMALLNTARSGFFSSDRSIREYSKSIWEVEPFPVEITCDVR